MNDMRTQEDFIKEETFSDSTSVKSNESNYESDKDSDIDIEEMSEVYLPKTDKLLPFFSLSDSDKCKVIELGLSFLQNGNKKTQLWDNKQWERKIMDIEKQSEKEIKSLQEQIQKRNRTLFF